MCNDKYTAIREENKRIVNNIMKSVGSDDYYNVKRCLGQTLDEIGIEPYLSYMRMVNIPAATANGKRLQEVRLIVASLICNNESPRNKTHEVGSRTFESLLHEMYLQESASGKERLKAFLCTPFTEYSGFEKIFATTYRRMKSMQNTHNMNYYKLLNDLRRWSVGSSSVQKEWADVMVLGAKEKDQEKQAENKEPTKTNYKELLEESAKAVHGIMDNIGTKDFYAVKRCLGQTLDEIGTDSYISYLRMENIPENNDYRAQFRKALFLTAGVICNNESPNSEVHASGSRTFESMLHESYIKGTPSSKERLKMLLNTPFTKSSCFEALFASIYRNMKTKQNMRGLNYDSLLADLRLWNTSSRIVQRKWARVMVRGQQPQTDEQGDATPGAEGDR